MSLLAGFEQDVLDHGKSLPDAHIALDKDFEVWGWRFCELMVSVHASTSVLVTNKLRRLNMTICVMLSQCLGRQPS
jgi:hypothetical protein